LTSPRSAHEDPRLTGGKDDITAKLHELENLVNGLVNGGFVTDQASRS